MTEPQERGDGREPPTGTATAAPGEDDELIERLEALSPERLRTLAAAIERRYRAGSHTGRATRGGSIRE